MVLIGCLYTLLGFGLRGGYSNVGQVTKFVYIIAFPVHAFLFEILRGLRWLAPHARSYAMEMHLGLCGFVAWCTYAITDGDWKKTAIAFCVTALLTGGRQR